MTARPVLLFDLDGTLTDPKAGIGRCMRFALDQLAAPCPTDEALVSFIGPPLRATFARRMETTDEALVEQAMRLFRQGYGATGLFENDVYEGVPEMLDACRQASSAMVMATSKPKVYADRIVKHFGLDQHFTRVYGSENELRRAGADRLCTTPRQLAACLSTI